MTKSKKENEVMDQEMQKVAIEDMPLNSLRDYRLYNEEAAKLNKIAKARYGRAQGFQAPYPYKQCPEELHPTERVMFGRVDQPSNALPVHISNNIIHFQKTLVPGQVYDLPQYVVSYLQSKGNPIYKWHTKEDGSSETYVSEYKPRFAIRTIYQEA
jgi:hypothetical protein